MTVLLSARLAKLQGFGGDELKKLEEVLARSKDVEEAIAEFRKFKEDTTEANLQKPKK